MNYERQKILIDIDDTLLKSSIEIIRELNTKNNTYKINIVFLRFNEYKTK